MRLHPIASSSSGNCVYAASQKTHILVDAGLSGKRIQAALETWGSPPLSAILLTHEHSDHAAGVGVLSRRFNIPVFAAPFTWRFLLRHGTIGKIDPALQRTLTPGTRETIGDIELECFDIPHDASQPVGFCLYADGRKAAVATDMGYVTDTVREKLRGVHALLLESNHDPEMLENGPYPRALKDRIKGSRGHLSNVAAGALLAEIASPALEHVYLGHLSEENNRPLLALHTVQEVLNVNGVTIPHLEVAKPA